MSRSLLAAALATTLLSSIFAPSASAEVRFSQPPPTAGAPMNVDDLRIQEQTNIIVNRAKVRAKLAANRAANLARFRAYQQKGVFPSNTFSDGKLNVWRDAYGHLCAAATIMNAGGYTDLVNQVADQDNFIRLADVTQGPVMNWILTSGFTQGEIAAIQEPFMGVADPGEPAPQPILAEPVIDPAKRKAEDRRLMARYRQVTSQLLKQRAASLDAATDRLIAENPGLAAMLAAS